jgi:hypothetical protein
MCVAALTPFPSPRADGERGAAGGVRGYLPVGFTHGYPPGSPSRRGTVKPLRVALVVTAVVLVLEVDPVPDAITPVVNVKCTRPIVSRTRRNNINPLGN